VGFRGLIESIWRTILRPGSQLQAQHPILYARAAPPRNRIHETINPTLSRAMPHEPLLSNTCQTSAIAPCPHTSQYLTPPQSHIPYHTNSTSLQAHPAASPSGKKSSHATSPTHPPTTTAAPQNASPYLKTTTSACTTRKRYASPQCPFAPHLQTSSFHSAFHPCLRLITRLHVPSPSKPPTARPKQT
jgi:hypothetical protein